MSSTLDYYNTHAADFTAGTKDVEFSAIQDNFIKRLDKGAKILDFGCGSGCDTKYFLDRGYDVTATDGSAELCKIATEMTEIPVKQMLFQELDEVETYDGVWACASILHLPYVELEPVFRKICNALKPNCILYTSFKYGNFEGERRDRYFTDLTEETFSELLKKIPELTIEEAAVTGDVRPGREDERWLNVILRKQ